MSSHRYGGVSASPEFLAAMQPRQPEVERFLAWAAVFCKVGAADALQQRVIGPHCRIMPDGRWAEIREGAFLEDIKAGVA